MLNTGNFVLISEESSTVWESFGDPTDTMLPTQTLELNQKLTSRLRAEDYSAGRFELILQTDGNLVLYTIARPAANNDEAYWSVNNGSQLVFNQSGYLYLTLNNGSIYYPTSTTSNSTRDYYQRVTLDFDGVLRQYTYPRNGSWPGSWSTSWSLPSDIWSLPSDICGFNSYCRPDKNQRPECICPSGYTYIDPKNTFGGCRQNFLPQNCGRDDDLTITEGFEMQPIIGANWPMNDYEWFKNVPENWCIEICLNDCFCAAAIFNSDSYLKKFPLSRGYYNPEREPGTKALIKVGNSNSSMENVLTTTYVVKKEDRKWIVPGSIGLGISVVVNLVLFSLVLFVACHKKQLSETQNETHNSGSPGLNLQSFTYNELEDATDGFKEELGKGASSTVYKGALKSDHGSHDVAVKRLERVANGYDKEFKAEVDAIGKTNHKNLVHLLGFCHEEAHRLLVYEFMKNGSLESFLFGSSRLPWSQRVQIAFGIARGLAYLHEDCSSQIIHCDIKPQNILIDDFYVARISDFGLDKLLKSDQTCHYVSLASVCQKFHPKWIGCSI